MAEIFLARPTDVALSKLVAIKRVLPKLLSDPSFTEMFRREGAIALRFRHHAIIAVHEMGVIHGQHYLSMEFFPGKTLNKISSELRDSKLSLGILEKILIIKNIAEALQYIHDFSAYGSQTEIIHRDISPHNIMVGYDGVTKLIDFGIAKDLSEGTHSSAIKGKIAYMSPEQVRGETLNKQSDIFSLGIVLWELLAGKKLFTGSSIKEVTQKVEACVIPPIREVEPNVPVALSLICERALSIDCRFRYGSAAELVSDLDEIWKSSSTDGVQKRLGEAVRSLFPEDVKNLHKQLREHEVTNGSGLVYSSTTPPPLPKSWPRKKKFSAVRIGMMLGVVAVIAFAGTEVIKMIYPATVRVVRPEAPVHEIPPPPRREPVAIKKEPVLEAAPQPPPPPPAPAPALERVPEPQPPPAAALAPKPAPTPAPKIAVEPKVVKEVIKKTISTKKPKAVAKVPSKKAVERKLASKRPPERLPTIAYLTVLTDPNARILVNGKAVGTEVINDLKVPADKNIAVTVVLSEGESPKTQHFTFKPGTHNVIEMGSSSPTESP